MSRIIKDPYTGEEREKGTTQFSPPAEEIARSPLKSAASYTQRVRERQEALASTKAKRVPLGHAEPIPEGKLAPLVEAAKASAMPLPGWEEDFLREKSSPQQPSPPKAPPQKSGPRSLAEMKRAAEERLESEEKKEYLEEYTESTLDTRSDDLEKSENEIVEYGKEVQQFFDFQALAEARTPLESAERRKIIEGRLPALSFEKLITEREIAQEISVIPGEFSVTCRTVKEREHLWSLGYVYENCMNGSKGYYDEMLSLCRLCMGVKAINGRMLPDHRHHIGQLQEDVDRDRFEKKLQIITDFPVQLVADLSVQFNWFSERVTALFSVDRLKNG